MKSGKETKNNIVLISRGDAQIITSSHPINSLLINTYPYFLS